MKVVSLFSGVGGFDLGAQDAGCEIVLHAEIDPQCRELLKAKFPKAIILADVRAIAAVHRRLRRNQPVPNEKKWQKIFRILRTADVFSGGFPCQDLSVAGQRKGLAGERSGLWFAFRRIIALFRPAWIVIENVPGLLSSAEGRDFGVLVAGLDELRYGLAWRSLDAQYFDVAQRRERVFIVGSLGTIGSSEVLFEPDSVCGDYPPRREAGENPAPTIAGCSNGGGANGPGRDVDSCESLIPEVAKCLNAGRDGYNDGSDQTYIAGAVSAKWAKGTGGPAGDECYNLTIANALTTKPFADREAEDSKLVVAPVAHPLTSMSSDASYRVDEPQNLIAFSCKDAGGDSGSVAPTLRSMNHEEGNANGGGQVAIAFDTTQITNPDNRSQPQPDGPCHTLSKDQHAPCIAFNARQDPDNWEERTGPLDTDGTTQAVAFRAAGQDGFTPSDVAPPCAATKGGNAGMPTVQVRQAVRRLTPRECERLQGFPDDWTAGFSDSVRYRMMGNAVNVKVSRWLFDRLKAFS